MSAGEWVLSALAFITIAFIVVIIIKESRNSNNVINNVTNTTIQEPKTEFFEAKALKKRIYIYYEDPIRKPRSVTQYFITFLLETGEEKEFSLPQEFFEKIDEGQESTLVLVNGRFFDFSEGETIENFEE